MSQDLYFGNRLTLALRKKGMTYPDLAAKLGLAPATVYRYASGIRTPNQKRIAQIADILGVDTDYLLCNSSYNTIYAMIREHKHSLSFKQKRDLIELLKEN